MNFGECGICDPDKVCTCPEQASSGNGALQEYSAKERAIMVLESHDLLEAAEELRDRTAGCRCSDCRIDN